MRLVLRHLVGMVDRAMVDAAGMDVELRAQIFLAHHRAFEVPTRHASAPGPIPFHLAVLAGGGVAADREILAVARVVYRVYPTRGPHTLSAGDAAVPEPR